MKYENTKFNDWTITTFIKGNKYNVQCSCGATFIRHTYDIVKGKSKKCIKCANIDRAKRFKGYRKSKPKPKTYNPNWKGTKDVPKDYFSQIQRGARSRNHSFNLTINDLQDQWDAQSGKCMYTNKYLIFRGRSKARNRTKIHLYDASLDRINSNKPYQVGNIQWVCKCVNMAKHQLSDEQFKSLITLIYLNM